MCIYMVCVWVAVRKLERGSGDRKKKRPYGKICDMKIQRAVMRLEEHIGAGPRAMQEEEPDRTKFV